MSDKEQESELTVESKSVQDARDEKLKDDEAEQEEHEKKEEEAAINKKRSLDNDEDTAANKRPAKVPETAPETKTDDEIETNTTPKGPEEKVAGEATEEKAGEEAPEKDTPVKNGDGETATKTDAPKFVFGSSTSFGNATAFSMFSDRKSIFDKADDKNTDGDSKADEDKTKPVFGGGSSFGNAFQSAMGKKSIFDQDPAESKEPSESGNDTDVKESTPSRDSVYQKVHLEKKQVTTGEEEETVLFAVKSKLYALDLTDVKEGWKEKGVGVLRLNESKDAKLRLLMRADAILKVILNFPITSETEVFKGMESSLQGEKFLRFNFVENDKPVQYALKFGQAENAKKLYDLIKDAST